MNEGIVAVMLGAGIASWLYQVEQFIEALVCMAGMCMAGVPR